MATTFTRGRHRRSIADKPLDRTFEPGVAGEGDLLQLSGAASLSIGSSDAALGVLLRRRDDDDFLGIVRFRIHSATLPRGMKSIRLELSPPDRVSCFWLLACCTALHF
jgi:hypothetical protein